MQNVSFCRHFSQHAKIYNGRQKQDMKQPCCCMLLPIGQGMNWLQHELSLCMPDRISAFTLRESEKKLRKIN